MRAEDTGHVSKLCIKTLFSSENFRSYFRSFLCIVRNCIIFAFVRMKLSSATSAKGSLRRPSFHYLPPGRWILCISIYKLGDVGISSNLIGSLSLTNGQCPPPGRWIMKQWPAKTPVLPKWPRTTSCECKILQFLTELLQGINNFNSYFVWSGLTDIVEDSQFL